ncbi:MAG: hypothetical protein WDW36_004330 [Sanguina aurantia]
MRAVVCEALGDATLPFGQGCLTLHSAAPDPALKPGHVKIQVSAASLNFPDALQIKGTYQDKLKPPFIPGSEVSGVVMECSAGVSGLKVGDKVCAVCSGGAFAEQVVVHPSSVWKVPDALELCSAAAVPIAYGTTDLALRHRAQLTAGQTILILGAAGGVGLAAVQISKLLGATVVAVVSSPEKAAFLRQQGADVVIDSSAATATAPLASLIKQAAPKGVNVVYDPVGGSQFQDALKSVAWGAHYLVIGFASGGIPKVAANILLVKNCTMHGIFWGSYLQFKPAVLHSSMNQVLAWLAEGKLTLQTEHRFRLEELPSAFQLLLSRRVLGKVLIMMQAQPRL